MAALVVAVLVAVAPGASAHATVVSTAPGDGQVVATAPSVVSVRFDEPVQMQFGALRVFSPSGSRVDEGSPSHPAGHSDTVEVGLAPKLGRGTYTVAWHVISADSHPVSGAFTFSVGASSTTSVSQDTLNAAGSTTVGVLYGIARGVAYGGFALAVGATAFLLCCWPAGAASRRVQTLIGVGWAALVAATLAVLGLQGPYDGGFGLGRVFDSAVLRTTMGTRLGTALSVRLLLLGAFGTGLAMLLPRLEQASVRLRIAAAGVGAAVAVGMAATWAAADHAGTGSQVALALPLDVLHVMAMAVWLGGLTVVVAVLLRPAGAGVGANSGTKTAAKPGTRSAVDPAVLAPAIRRFSTIAACCIAVLVASGTYQAWRQVGTLGALTGTVYGKLLLVKLLGVGLVVALGYLARVWIAHYLADRATPDEVAIRQLRRSTGLEAVLAIGVLTVTAMLVNAPPARTAFAAPVSTTAAFDTGGPNGKGTVQVFVSPAKAGTDLVHIEVVSPSGEPEAVPELTATLSLPDRQLGPLPITLSGAGTSHYYGNATIPLAGGWKLAVTVRTDDIDETTVTIPVTIR
ncbi:copper resistance protein CopC [Catenulispora sp. GP43]|uniref:copper resistance CopC/CopD family protein n=1 Tax=Catenulispora sp. GP43 TaxID=3156263 RepID=UPI003519BA0D